ncbi:hypothetical protein D1159_01115 [Pseudoflavonifractor sp. 524-17]|uniref:hypothetical protein n=1 Tax=Pseudoflavonifractor sp. 524-17 TaxID=2304577 RepID=UPI00137AAE02|nr:hypothetical protein [Pseudoflavonifractor sp. 524-17]NCE63211.1 hypothetical protein [Pseudoflavonifractor sp. 524-17]
MLSLSVGLISLVFALLGAVLGIVFAIINIPLALFFHLVLPTLAFLYGVYLLVRGLSKKPFVWTELIPGGVVLAVWYLLWH